MLVPSPDRPLQATQPPMEYLVIGVYPYPLHSALLYVPYCALWIELSPATDVWCNDHGTYGQSRS